MGRLSLEAPRTPRRMYVTNVMTGVLLLYILYLLSYYWDPVPTPAPSVDATADLRNQHPQQPWPHPAAASAPAACEPPSPIEVSVTVTATMTATATVTATATPGTPGTLVVPAAADKQATNGRIGKVSMLYGEPSEAYERGVRSHAAHAEHHGYPLYVLREKLLAGLWSKHAFLFQLITQELSKAADERLEWLFWFDADTYAINKRIPLSVYLPPAEPPFANVSLLCGNDHHGLNDGAFFLRVAPWSLELLATAMALPRFRPEIDLPYTEQSALELVVEGEGEHQLFPLWKDLPKELKHARTGAFFSDARAAIPQRWVNAYVGARSWNGTRLPAANGKRPKDKPNSVQEGDVMVHFAGNGKEKRDRMQAFMDGIEADPAPWVVDLGETDLETEVAAFWATWAAERTTTTEQ